APARQARFLVQFALCRRERVLIKLARPRRKLEEPGTRRLARLADERDEPLPVDGHDGNGARMPDDLAFLVAPLLDRNLDLPAVERDLERVGLHCASRRSAASVSARVTSTIRSRSSTAICSSDVWMFAIPLARLRHWRP